MSLSLGRQTERVCLTDIEAIIATLKSCQAKCEEFIRNTLPLVSNAKADIPTLPAFTVVSERKGARRRVRYVEHAESNWWQLPKELHRSALQRIAGQEFLKSLGSTPPFSKAIGNALQTAAGRGVQSISAAGIAREILMSYLFAAGLGRWRPGAFKRVWDDCTKYFDPTIKHIKYVLYAPLWGFGGVSRSVDLGQGLTIRRLPNREVARIATLEPGLAGVTPMHRFTLWPSTFFLKAYEFRKHIGPEKDWPVPLMQHKDPFHWLNQETAMLRSLLNEQVSVPSYAFVYDGYPRDPGGGPIREMPWRARMTTLGRKNSRTEINRYVKRRAQFKDLQRSPGWAAVAASMRRFALAWENPFPADSLADIVAAFEILLVRDDKELSYKLRIRASRLLTRQIDDQRAIIDDFKAAYSYRSDVAHGKFVFDDPRELETARALGVKGKGGNLFHDVNEIHRLKGRMTSYFRAILDYMIRTAQLEIDWAGRAF